MKTKVGARAAARPECRPFRQRRGVAPREDEPSGGGPATSKCPGHRRLPMAIIYSSLGARLLGAGAGTRRSSSARRPPISRPAQREEICALGRKIAEAVELRMRRHHRVPDGYGLGRILLHRGHPAHPRSNHTVTEEVTGIDIVRAQILVGGRKIPRRSDRCGVAIRRAAERSCHPVPGDDGGPEQQLHSRLRSHHHLALGHRHGHPSSTASTANSGAVITRYYDTQPP